MTRAERIDRACAGYVGSTEPGTTHRDGIEAALDAALADVGGLDGLGDALTRLDDRARQIEERQQVVDRYRADRDRLREALRTIAALAMPGSENGRTAEAALRESEAGS